MARRAGGGCSVRRSSPRARAYDLRQRAAPDLPPAYLSPEMHRWWVWLESHCEKCGRRDVEATAGLPCEGCGVPMASLDTATMHFNINEARRNGLGPKEARR